MSLNYITLWLQCFWNVITPNWYTLGMLVAALLIIVIMKQIYRSKQITDKNAMKQIGKRWMAVGIVIIILSLIIFIAECVIMYTGTVNIVANKDEPKQEEYELFLRLTAYDFAKLHAKNAKKLELDELKWETLYDEYEPRETVTLAEKRQIELEKKFNENVKGTNLGKFYRNPDALNDRNRVVDAFRKACIAFKCPDNTISRYRDLSPCADKLFTDPLYLDVIANFKAKFNAAFDKNNQYHIGGFKTKIMENGIVVGTRDITGDHPDDFNKGLLEINLTLDDARALYGDLIPSQINILNQILNSKATSDPDNTETFADLFGGDFCTALRGALVRAHTKTLNPKQLSEDVQKIAKKVAESKKFKNDKERVAEVVKQFNAKMGKTFAENLKKAINAELEGQEKLLYTNDELDYHELKDKEKALNKNLVSLLNNAIWLNNLFWFVIISLFTLFFFILRGRKIIALGNPQKIKSKIKG